MLSISANLCLSISIPVRALKRNSGDHSGSLQLSLELFDDCWFLCFLSRGILIPDTYKCCNLNMHNQQFAFNLNLHFGCFCKLILWPCTSNGLSFLDTSPIPCIFRLPMFLQVDLEKQAKKRSLRTVFFTFRRAHRPKWVLGDLCACLCIVQAVVHFIQEHSKLVSSSISVCLGGLQNPFFL